jgi:exopolysaccharide production protein ExoQ
MTMLVHYQANTVPAGLTLAEKVSRTAFVLYVIFMLVGAATPFQDQDLGGSTSNPINQAVDSVIPLVSLLCIWPKRKNALSLLREEKYLTLLMVWSLVSVLWSDFPFTSFKAAVRLIGSTTVIVAFFLNANSTTDALKYIKGVLMFYMASSFLAIALVPGATQWEWPAWRGLADHKNTLGQIAFVSTVVWASGIRGVSIRRRTIAAVFLLASLVLVLGSKSTTAVIVLLSISFMSVWLFVDRRAGRMVSLTIIGCLLSLVVMADAVDLGEIIGTFGKDTTFTGRTDIWMVMLDEAKAHPFIGCGLAGFWVTDNPSVLALYAPDLFPWRPTEGHEGYLDLLDEIGAVGILLLALMVIFYFRNLAKLRKPHFWKWFFIGILIVNLTESTLFRSASFTGWMFVLSYVALYAELIQSKAHAASSLPAAA